MQMVLQKATGILKQAGVENPSLDARMLLAFVLGTSHTSLLFYDKSITSRQEQDFFTLISKRASRIPVSRIVGQRGFYKLEFSLNSDTLDPRPDSETLVEAVLRNVKDKNYPYKILDLGTGSGCLLLSVLYDLPNATGVGIDIAENAVTKASENAQLNGLRERASFINASWKDFASSFSSAPTSAKFDIVISNPPYIPNAEIETLAPEVKNFDPYKALAGGQDGLDCYREIASLLPDILAENGAFYCEIGKGQELDVTNILGSAGYQIVSYYKDFQNITRVLYAKKYAK